MAEFDESKHPRDEEGKFTYKGGGRQGTEGDKRREAVKKYSDDPGRDMAEMGLIRTSDKKHAKKIPQLDKMSNSILSIYQIMEYTGFSHDEATKTFEAIQYYTKTGYSDIRSGKNKEAEINLEKFIQNHPAYDGKIYRGIAISHGKSSEFLKKIYEAKDTGTLIDMGGISSWSSEESVAIEFAENREQSTGSYQFIFEMDNESGVGIDHLSEWHGEMEVLQSGKQKYEVVSVDKSNYTNRYKIILKEQEHG